MPPFSFLAKIPRALFALACLAALPIHAQTPISESALRNIRIDVQFEAGSGYENNAALQEEFVRGAELAMRMWESIFPTMRVYFVSLHDKPSANLTFMVGNYAGLSRGSCGTGGGAPGGTWWGCSYFPDANGNIAGGKIYFNTGGYQRYFHDRFVYFSRDKLYNSYEPATYPPVGYGNTGLANGMGWIDGRYKSAAGGQGVNWIVFHEFGHSVGLGHISDDALKFYGVPYPAGQTPGTVPNLITPNTGAYPYLTEPYYGGGTPSSPWLPNIRPLGMTLAHMTALNNKPLGVAVPSTELFNFHVVHPDDISMLTAIMPSSRINYPMTKGLIRLQKTTGAVSLTSSWKQAINLAQLDRTGAQSDPFYVTGIFNSSQIQRIAPGAFHTLAIRNDGTLWAWGANDQGQLGNGSFTATASPISIGSSLLGSGRTWVSVAAGENFSVALRSDNALFAWGSRSNGQVGDGVFSGTQVTTPRQVPGTWSAIKAGPLHALGLKTDGTLWGWGYNGAGQLGNGNYLDQAWPVQEFSKNKDWISLSAGSLHSTGMRAAGTVWSWGWNDYGTLGNDTYSGTNVPVQESYNSPYWVVSDAGHEHTVAMTSIGQLFVWGRNQLKQLGTATTLGTASYPLHLADGFVSAASGHWHNAGIKQDGSLWSWGYNGKGQLGANLAPGGTSSTLMRESSNSVKWTDAYPGKEQTLAMKTDGTVWAWGDNTYGQLGTGSTSATPVQAPVRSKFADKPTLVLKAGFTATETPRAAPFSQGLQATATVKPSVYLSADTRGNIVKVEYFNGATLINSAVTSAPYKTTFANLGRGQYKITARLTSSMGDVITSPIITVNVHQVDIPSTLGTTPASVNLTTEAGTAGDWVQWGHNGTKPWITRKNLATQLIKANVSVPSSLARYTNATSGFSWTDGSGAVSVTNSKGYAATGEASYWSHEFPSSTSARTAKLWIRVSPGGVVYPNFELGDLWVSIPMIQNLGTTVMNRVITVTYGAATSGLTARLSLSMGHAAAPGNVGIQAIVYK